MKGGWTEEQRAARRAKIAETKARNKADQQAYAIQLHKEHEEQEKRKILERAEFVRGLRENPTKSEAFIKPHLEALGFEFQKELGWYVADFCHMRAHMVIEIDGPSHIGRAAQDREREENIASWGFTVLRFSDTVVSKQLDDCLNVVRKGIDFMQTVQEFREPELKITGLWKCIRQPIYLTKFQAYRALDIAGALNGIKTPKGYYVEDPSKRVEVRPRTVPACVDSEKSETADTLCEVPSEELESE